MKILLSWSSGKDSAWALHLLNTSRPGCVAGLLTSVNEAVDRVAMHGVSRDVLDGQALAAGLPLRTVEIPHPCPNDTYEARMSDAVAAAVAEGFTHAAFGDLFLEDVRRYREDRLRGSGLLPLFPVWGIPRPCSPSRCSMEDYEPSSHASTVGLWTRPSSAVSGTGHFYGSYQPASIHVANAVSFTPASTPAPCSRGRWHCTWANA